MEEKISNNINICYDCSKDVQDILGLMAHPNDSDNKLIQKAYDFAKEAHHEHKRLSGEPYLVHLVSTAKNLAKLRADTETIAAGLLHDTLEDTKTTKEDIVKNFSEDIFFMVEGVTKLGKIKYHGLERHAESLRKLFIATAKDIRVLLIKLADRLNNVETLKNLHDVKPENAKRIALETIEIYAPIANRLGMGQMKGKLEDNSFPFLYPDEYKQTQKLVQSKSKEFTNKLSKINRVLCKRLVKAGITKFKTDFRVKHIYSLYKKLLRSNMDIDKVYDISALRIIVPSTEDCYRVLGIIHNTWRPLPDKLKDYIAVPKPNGYQSIHTVIFTGDGGMVEIQIRSEKMHEEAEFGITSHIAYDEQGKPKSGGVLTKKIRWINRLIEWQKNLDESENFLDNLKTDFFTDQIFVFTPKGDVIELPEGASPIDFAYIIHSDIGNHAFGAKVNNKFVSFDTVLKNGDIVDIITRENSTPSYKWLEFAKTTEAIKRIKMATGTNENARKKDKK
ncbi:MAG: RelA/SpoT family protein [bacterium]